MKTIIYVISQVSHSKLFEWTARALNRDKYKLVFVLMHSRETTFETNLRNEGFEVFRLTYLTKKDIPSCVLQMRAIFKNIKPDILHTHLFEAGIAGMTAARICRIPVRIHTRHDAMIHHDFHPAAVKYDKFINRLSTRIIAISENVKEILMNLESVPQSKISIVPHGFELNEYSSCSENRKEAIRIKYNLQRSNFPIIGCVSRFIKWKGIQYTIKAFEQLLHTHPEAVLLLANAQGPYEADLMNLLKRIPEKNYRRIIFEPDVTSLYHVMDVFVHVPIDSRSEAYGQVYIEALAAGVPSVFTASGIVPECVKNREEAIVVPFCDSDAILYGVKEVLSNDQLRSKLRSSGSKMVYERYSIAEMISKLETVYDS